MDDPRLLPPPENHLDRIHAFALDLAYGFSVGEFPSKYIISGIDTPQTWIGQTGRSQKDNLDSYLSEKWELAYPHSTELEMLNYIQYKEHTERGSRIYTLTPKALTLMEQPAKPPTIFISYKRDESAAFGLLIVARLKMAGITNPFIDMDIRPGDEWHAYLQKTIQQSEYFVSLLAPTTLDSAIVKQEIEWARQANLQIIPIWHNRFDGYENLPSELSSKNAIRVKEESAEEYNNAVILLLNRLGYAP